MATTASSASQSRITAWTGWIAFAGWLMVIIGALDAFEGLIAIIRKQYYVLGPNQIIIFNMTTWGWLTLLWGFVLVFAGLALLTGASWARWFTIVVASLNFFNQLAYLGNSASPLWLLTTLGLTLVVLYALIVRWDDAPQPSS
jgi:hypothetical protein